jgi:UDP-N-acetylmuramyl pentapeptide synthase
MKMNKKMSLRLLIINRILIRPTIVKVSKSVKKMIIHYKMRHIYPMSLTIKIMKIDNKIIFNILRIYIKFINYHSEIQMILTII